MSVQLDLFAWADSRPCNVINARGRFEERTIELGVAMARGRVAIRNGDVVPFIRRANIAPLSGPPAGGMRGAR